MRNTLIILLGPTGIGKTGISIDIAKHFHTEIISCDSRQFYKEMTIGTAVPSVIQLKEVKHHFIQHLSVDQYYSASLYETDSIKLLNKLFRKKNIVIMTGGSGLYIDAVCGTIDAIPDVDPDIRDKYLKKFEEEGIESIRTDLRLLDPDHYARIDLRNPKRILRALEICETTGKPYSSFLIKEGKKRNFNIIKAGLQTDRETLYNRINSRVDGMIASGLVEEARQLYPGRHLNALNTVGYKELFSFFDDKTTLEKAIELIKRNSRRYAKRQITWWTRDNDITWFTPGEVSQIIKFIEDSSDQQ